MLKKTCETCVWLPFLDFNHGGCLKGHLPPDNGYCEHYKCLAIYAESLADDEPTPHQTCEATGAVRGTMNEPAWYLLPFQAINELASVCSEGAVKYGPRNCERGLPISNLLNHAMIHIGKYILSETTDATEFASGELEAENHLAHAAWNIMFALEIRARVKQGLLKEELVKL